MTVNGGIPRFSITLPNEEHLDLMRAILSTPGVESSIIHPTTEAGTRISVIGASFEQALENMPKKLAVVLERIKLAETIAMDEAAKEVEVS